MRHRLGKGVVGIVAGFATIGLLSLPAAANTKNIEFVNLTGTTPGNITVFNADDEPVTTMALPGTAGLTCSTNSTTSTAMDIFLSGTATTGVISIYMTNRCGAFVSGTNQFCSYLTAVINGTYTATKSYTSSSLGTVAVVLKKNTGTTHNCHSVTTTNCTLTMTGLSVSGIIGSIGALPTLANSDVATMAGSSPNGSLLVSGTASACGLFIGGNNGSASINVKVHVVH
jgi:hypothetical protein